MTNEQFIKHLDALEDKAYRDQPDMMGTVLGLIGLLTVKFCEHQIETIRDPDGPDGPGEMHRACKKCGYEPTDE